MEDDIKNSIREAVASLEIGECPDFILEHPSDPAHGDFSANTALLLAKQSGKNPKDLALIIAEKITKSGLAFAGVPVKVEVAGAGFINFFLPARFFSDSIKKINKEGGFFGESESSTKGKMMIEYTDPNPFKEFHIGHLMTNAIGEALSRIVEADGFEVKRACYQGDVGLHVAKAIWGALYMKKEDGEIDWFKVYAMGSRAYDSSPEYKKEIEEINKKIYAREDAEINALYDEGRAFSLDEFEKIYATLGTKFDYYFFERETATFGKRVVEENKGKIFEESDGAVIFRGEKHGLHTRVFINGENLPTYEAKELGLAKIKHDKYAYDLSVVVTANEINEYFKVLLCAMSFVFPDLSAKTRHIGHGMLRLPGGKMSSRTGDVITARSLIEKISDMAGEKIRDRDLNDEEKKQASEKVAVGAIKYSILKQAIGSDIIYDFEKSISFEGDSGPYLQYSYARAMSVLRRYGESEEKIKNLEFEIEGEPNLLERAIIRFPSVVARSAKEFAPHRLANFLTELSGAFNSFYAGNQIVGGGKETNRRLALTRAFSLIMKKGLTLLAIPVMEKM